jgi:hypothetical protein
MHFFRPYALLPALSVSGLCTKLYRYLGFENFQLGASVQADNGPLSAVQLETNQISDRPFQAFLGSMYIYYNSIHSALKTSTSSRRDWS